MIHTTWRLYTTFSWLNDRLQENKFFQFLKILIIAFRRFQHLYSIWQLCLHLFTRIFWWWWESKYQSHRSTLLSDVIVSILIFDLKNVNLILVIFFRGLISSYIPLSFVISFLFTYIWYRTLLINLKICIRYLRSLRMIFTDLKGYWIVSYDGIDRFDEFLLVYIIDFRVSTTSSLYEKIENSIISSLESDFSWLALNSDWSSRLDLNSNSWSKFFLFFILFTINIRFRNR